MGKYLYNGVPLQKIPTVEGCPYEYIVNADGVYCVCLSDRKTEAYNTGNVILQTNSPAFKYEDDEWIETSWVQFPSVYPLIWTNYDLYYKTNESYGELSGTLCLAASEPVPVGTAPEIYPVLMTAGYRLGCIVRAQRARKKEPVAYLYNGVPLPALPKEWDREMYPYAAIGRIVYSDGSRGIWKFIARETPFIAYDNESGHIIWMMSTPIMYDHTTDKPNEWVINTTGIYSALEYLWSNHDVCSYDDGTVVVHKASEPVPIYE